MCRPGVYMGRRVVSHEGFDRNGHWTREFSLHAEGWTVVEHWAGEHGFGLVHFKGKRRIYRCGDNAKLYLTYIECRLDEEENRLHISAWIEAGGLIRLISLFKLPPVLDISPSGFWGIRTRRKACHALNSLLQRMRQPTILGSESFHWADLDGSTIALVISALSFMLPFFIFGSALISITPGLSNGLMQVLAKYAGFLGGLVAVFSTIQQGWVTRRWKQGPTKLLFASGMSTILFVSTIFLFTRTRTEMRDQKLSYFCVRNFEAEACGNMIDKLSPEERTALLNRVFELEDALVRRDKTIKERQIGR